MANEAPHENEPNYESPLKQKPSRQARKELRVPLHVIEGPLMQGTVGAVPRVG